MTGRASPLSFAFWRNRSTAPEPCENCGHVEVIYFQCPACGRSFKVASETSERIFCSRFCRDFGLTEVAA